MPDGYNGRILHVDLSTRETTVEEPPALWYRTYLGGGAMASYYLLKELQPDVDPLSKENILVFASNVVSGGAHLRIFPLHGSGQVSVSTRRPFGRLSNSIMR